MAKSKSFFGIRRGSTKSLTFSVYRGQQITKDRVTSVRNPQTNGQMEQRLKLPLVSNARSVLKDLVNHSFEGVTYGDESLKYFSQENLRAGNLDILEFVPKGAMDCGLANFVVSKGSLDAVELFPAEDGGNPAVPTDDVPPYVSLNAFARPLQDANIKQTDDYASGKPVPAALLDYIRSEVGLPRESQLTLLLCHEGLSYLYFSAKDVESTASYHRFVVSRLKFGDDPNGVNSHWVMGLTEHTGEGDNKILTGFTITDGYIKIETFENGANTSICVSFSSNVIGDNEDSGIESAAAIVSLQNSDSSWRRSPARMKLMTTKTSTPYDKVIYSYLHTKASSSKYLNSGVDGVSITGGEGSDPSGKLSLIQ